MTEGRAPALAGVRRPGGAPVLRLRTQWFQGGGRRFVAEPRDGGFAQPVSLGAAVNSEANEGSPFVAPDGRTLICLRDSDLWVSFRGEDGRWTPARKLNAPEGAVCPYVSPDGKYFFFLKAERLPSGEYAHDVCWMDASGLRLDGAAAAMPVLPTAATSPLRSRSNAS